MKNSKKDKNLNPKERDANRDPISGAPGAHPIGTGAGAAAGGAAGAAIGAAAGPAGAVVGAAAGAIIGGLGGKGAAEKANPTDPIAKERDRNLRHMSDVDRDVSNPNRNPAEYMRTSDRITDERLREDSLRDVRDSYRASEAADDTVIDAESRRIARGSVSDIEATRRADDAILDDAELRRREKARGEPPEISDL